MLSVITPKPHDESADEPTMGTKLPFPAGFRARRASDESQPRTAFVLSGGGNQGVSQVGMLRALLERGIVPDVVIGTSAGALNGAAVAYAPNLTGVAQLAAVWEQLRADHVFPGGRIHRAWNIVRRGTHLFGNEGLAALIHHSTPARSFSDLEIPLRVIAKGRSDNKTFSTCVQIIGKHVLGWSLLNGQCFTGRNIGPKLICYRLRQLSLNGKHVL